MHVCVKMMSKGSKEALTVLIMTIFYFFRLLQHRIFHTTLQHSMQYAVLAPLTYLLFSQTSFWQEGSLDISNHLPDSSFA